MLVDLDFYYSYHIVQSFGGAILLQTLRITFISPNITLQFLIVNHFWSHAK